MDATVSPLFCQEAVVAVFLHQSIRPPDTSTCNSTLIPPSQKRGSWLITGNLLIFQVRYLNNGQSNLPKDTKRADMSASMHTGREYGHVFTTNSSLSPGMNREFI